MNPADFKRRDFLVTAGLTISPLLASGEPAHGAPAPAVSSASVPALANKQIIDCQSHVFVPEVVALMKKRSISPRLYSRTNGEGRLVVGKWDRRMVSVAGDIKTKLAAMDDAGISFATLSTNDPGPEQFGTDGPAVARLVHDYLADVVKQYPTRFVGLATLPLQDMPEALKELDRCVELGMKGILLYSNIAGKFPDEPEFRPLFRRAEELDLPILLHPPVPVTFDATLGYNLTGGLGLMFDTTIALARIILSGILDQHPNLKLLCPHVGGTLPYLIGRIDHQLRVLKRMESPIKKSPIEYLKNVYLDAVNALPMVIRFGYDFVGPDRLLYASDHPWVDPKLILENIQSLNLPVADQQKIFADNARKLFKLG